MRLDVSRICKITAYPYGAMNFNLSGSSYEITRLTDTGRISVKEPSSRRIFKQGIKLSKLLNFHIHQCGYEMYYILCFEDQAEHAENVLKRFLKKKYKPSFTVVPQNFCIDVSE